MRDSGLVSNERIWTKSTFGHGNRSSTPPAAGRCAAEHCLHIGLHVLLKYRPLGPLPFTLEMSTPNSRAKRRTEGVACER